MLCQVFLYTYVENFETSNIQYTNELDTLLAGFKGLIDTLDEPLEQTIEDGLCHGTDRVQDLGEDDNILSSNASNLPT